MSALPPKADICSALAHVRFGPKADIGRELIEKIKDRSRRLRDQNRLRVRIRVRRLGNPGYQFAETATKLSIKDVFDAVTAPTH
jgi:hypothetical protein